MLVTSWYSETRGEIIALKDLDSPHIVNILKQVIRGAALAQKDHPTQTLKGLLKFSPTWLLLFGELQSREFGVGRYSKDVIAYLNSVRIFGIDNEISNLERSRMSTKHYYDGVVL